MTREDIIRMAREANRYAASQTDDSLDFPLIRDERFAALVSATYRDRRAFEIAECYRCGWDSGANAEREACARAASIALLGADKSLSDRVLNAIRSRGQSE